MAAGVDYAWSHPSPAALKKAGIAFAMRYLSTDASKSLTKSEATALAAEGIWVGVVWETTANRALGGKAAGQTDAKSAQKQAAACGMPAGRPIYFAVDFDATPAQQTQINAYLDGAAAVLGRSRVGIYGGFYPVKRALDAGKATWAWQTRAWSGGQWDARAHIRQGAYVKIGGVECDANTSEAADFGQWMPGKTPTPDIEEELMSLSKKDMYELVWTGDYLPAPESSTTAKTNPTWQPASFLRDIYDQNSKLQQQVADLQKAVAALAKKVGA